MSISLKSLEIYIHQNPIETAQMSLISTNNSSFTTTLTDSKQINITYPIDMNVLPHQITYWVKDYSTQKCPPTSYNFVQLHSNSSEVVKILGNNITISNITRLFNSANINSNANCKVQPRTVAKIIILYTNETINF